MQGLPSGVDSYSVGKEIPCFYRTQSSLLRSEKSTTGPYPESAEFHSNPHNLFIWDPFQ